MGPTEWVIVVVISLLLFVVGLVLGYFIRVKQHDKSLNEARARAEAIVAEGKALAEKLKREAILEAKTEIQEIKRQAEADIKERKTVVLELEHKLTLREESLDRRSLNLDKREESLNLKESKLDDKKIELEQLNIKVDELLAQQQ